MTPASPALVVVAVCALGIHPVFAQIESERPTATGEARFAFKRTSGSWTQFLGWHDSNPDNESTRYGGYLAAEFDFALPREFSINVYPELIYGENINTGPPGIFPPNVGLAYPTKDDEDVDVSLFGQKRIGDITIQFGKINSVRRGRATPMISGGGLEGFQHTVLASPPSIIGQPVRFGAMATIPLNGPTLGVGIWDPNSAVNRSGLEDAFKSGVAGYAQISLPVTIRGKAGSQKVALYLSSKRGLDLDEIPEITLPAESETVLGNKKGQWHLQYSFTHDLWRPAAGSGPSWGLFGRLGLWDANPTPFRWQAALGVGGDAPFPRRSRDRFGIGVFKTQLSETLRDGLRPIVSLGHDSGAELFYTFALVDRVRLTLNAEWVDPARTVEAQVRFLGLRLHLDF